MTDATPTTAYCVTGKTKRDPGDAYPATRKPGTPALQGICPICGIKLTRILPRSSSSSGTRVVAGSPTSYNQFHPFFLAICPY